MAFRRMFNVLLKRTIQYTASPIFVSCANNFEDGKPNTKIQWVPPDPTKFTHEFMIKKSTVDTVNSTSQALTVAYTAFEAASEEYRMYLSRLMSLMKETLQYRVDDAHWDAIIALRSEVHTKKQIVTDLASYLEYIEKMAIAATEVTFAAGMEDLSTSLCQRLDDATNNIRKNVKHNEQLEEEYRYVQEETIKKMKKPKGDAPSEEIKVETILAD